MKRPGNSWMKILPLCMLVQGCLSVGSGAPPVSVEEVKLLANDVGMVLRRDGVELEDISAVPLVLHLSNSDFSEGDAFRYFHVTNKMILDVLKSKLGTNYLKFLQKFAVCQHKESICVLLQQSKREEEPKRVIRRRQNKVPKR